MKLVEQNLSPTRSNRKRASVANRVASTVAVMLLSFGAQISLGQDLDTQQTELLRLIRKTFIVIPAYHHCYPAEVKGVAFGNQPLDVLLAQVVVENRSDKTITAVKLGWRVHAFPTGILRSSLLCGVPPADEVFLSGCTRLIELGSLAPAETINISTNPPAMPLLAPKTVFVEHPILNANDVKSLPVDENRKAEKYAVALYISEIHYRDGTRWVFKDN